VTIFVDKMVELKKNQCEGAKKRRGVKMGEKGGIDRMQKLVNEEVMRRWALMKD
jgi:hypothetical protein